MIQGVGEVAGAESSALLPDFQHRAPRRLQRQGLARAILRRV